MEMKELLTYFNAHNRSRIERLVELSPSQHQLFFQLLPLIFQSNDAGLPAYVEDAPLGIVNYQPTENLLATAKKHHPSFSYHGQAFHQYPIQGLYLLNDAGTLNYSKSQSFSLWLIYSSYITDEQTELLKKKLHKVLTLAKSLGITLNARILNDTSITDYKLGSSDLDRLYSSGLILAGCVPLWWFISPEQEADYAKHVSSVTAGIPNSISTLDFGPLGKSSAPSIVNTAISASLAAMEKGLSGYLELFYQQTLLEHFPDSLWLAPHYKQKVYQQQTNSFFCEPYILKFELMLENSSSEVADFLKRSLYLLCDERLSLTVKSPKHAWRRESISDLTSQWQWQDEDLVELDQHKQATIRFRLDEFSLTKKLTKQLNNAITHLATSSVADAAKKVVALQKKYQDIFDSPPDVIPRLPTSSIPETAEENLFVEYDSEKLIWTISEIDKATLKKGEVFSALYQGDTLVQTLAWAILNGALAKYTRVKLIANSSEVTNQSAHALIEYLVKSPLLQNEVSDANLNWLMFANVEKTPKEAYKPQDMKLSLPLRDPLNYGYHRRNLILGIEVLVSSDNKNWHYIKHSDNTATGEVLANLIRWQTNNEQHKFIDSWCATPAFSSNINKRLISLGQDISAHFDQTHKSGRYILEVADCLNRIQWQEQNVDATLIANRFKLNNLLSQARTEFSATHIDDNFEQVALYRLLLKEQAKGQVRVFMNVQKSDTDIYILDELGHIFKQRHTGQRENTLLTNFNHFLSGITQLNKLDAPKFYKLSYKDDIWSAKAIIPPSDSTSDGYLPVKVKMNDATNDSPCSILCGAKIFKGKANDPKLFQQVHQSLIQLRQSKADYPLYISDITFSQDKPYSSYHYIMYKQRIELVLNSK